MYADVKIQSSNMFFGPLLKELHTDAGKQCGEIQIAQKAKNTEDVVKLSSSLALSVSLIDIWCGT